MRTVKMLANYDRNVAGDICGFPDDEAAKIVAAGSAVYYDAEAEAEVEVPAPVEESAESASDGAESESGDESDAASDDLAELGYGELKKRAYAKAAETGEDITDALPDQRSETLKDYLRG